MAYELPARFAEYNEARQRGFLTVKKVKEDGGRVAGIFCTFTPLEILDAAGFLSVSLCGMSGETIPAAEAHLPRNLCPLIKSSYGFALTDKCPYTYFSDLIVGETTCDGKKKMYELLASSRSTPSTCPRGWTAAPWRAGRRSCAGSSPFWRSGSACLSRTKPCGMRPGPGTRSGGPGWR